MIDWEMGRDVSEFQPKSLLIFVAALVLVFLTFSHSRQMGKAGNGKVLQYKGIPVHCIIPGFIIQGGNIVSGDGRGNQSIYGGTFHGVVSMANSAPDFNGLPFYITTVEAYWLDGEHVVFGKVIDEMDTVYAIEGSAGTYRGKLRKKVIVADWSETYRKATGTRTAKFQPHNYRKAASEVH